MTPRPRRKHSGEPLIRCDLCGGISLSEVIDDKFAYCSCLPTIWTMERDRRAADAHLNRLIDDANGKMI